MGYPSERIESIVDDPSKEAYLATRRLTFNGVDLFAGQLIQLPKSVDLNLIPDGLVRYDEQVHGRRCRTIEQDGFPVGYIHKPSWNPWAILER